MPSRKGLSRRALLEQAGLCGISALVTSAAGKVVVAGNVVQALSHDERALIADLAETIIPETDTPGARSVGVAQFVEHILTAWYSAAERNTFLRDLSDFRELCQRRHGRAFAELSTEERVALLEELDRDAMTARQARADPLPFFAKLKELTVVGYYTSRAGMEAIGYYGPIGAHLGAFGPNRSGIWN